jgi:thiamine biosynthesis lipoprotein
MYRFLFFFLLVLLGCTQLPKEPVRLMGEAQGTYYSIIYYDEQQRDLQFEIDSVLKVFDQSVSLWVPNSILSQINNNDVSVKLDKYFIDNFKLSMEVAEKTNGNFDPTVGSLVRAWGFGFDAEKKVDTAIVDSILQFTGYKRVRLVDETVVKDDTRTTFDFNAVAQGYSVDLICGFLENLGIENYLVDIGGEVKGKGNKPDGSFWKVGIDKPVSEVNEARDLKAIIELKYMAIATSGNYRKFYEENGVRYSHTINPKTGYPVQHSLLSASVLAKNAAVADAYATAFMVMGLEQSREFVSQMDELEAYFIYSDKDGNFQTFATPGFQKQITQSFE